MSEATVEDTDRMYTTAEVAELVRMSKSWVRTEIQAGRLSAKDVSRGRGRPTYRVPAASLREFVKSLPNA